MKARQLMMIGYGAMGRQVHSLLPAGMQLRWLLVPEKSRAAVQEKVGPEVQVMSHLDDCDQHPDLVVECAGQASVHEHAEAVLRRGLTLALISVGALADDALYQRLHAAAHEGDGKLIILPGAIAGMDGLSAAREGGLEEVTYESSKAPRSWRGSHAEKLIDLDAVETATVFFEGSASEAARLFPANANVAATIGLAGVGMTSTRVKLIVQPKAQCNTHRIYAKGRFGQFQMELNGLPLDENPKTSMLAALSVVRACRQALDPMAV